MISHRIHKRFLWSHQSIDFIKNIKTVDALEDHFLLISFAFITFQTQIPQFQDQGVSARLIQQNEHFWVESLQRSFDDLDVLLEASFVQVYFPFKGQLNDWDVKASYRQETVVVGSRLVEQGLKEIDARNAAIWTI